MCEGLCVWCVFDASDFESRPELIAIVDDEDKAIQLKRNMPNRDIEIEEWMVK